MHKFLTYSAFVGLALSPFTVIPCFADKALPESAGYGPNPTLPAPDKKLVPTVKVAEAIGWPAGAMPKPAAGFEVKALATGLDHPRWLHMLPNGDILVAETNAPERPEEGKGIKGKVMGMQMKKAGAATPSANRITLLRASGEAASATRTTFLQGLNSPFGMAVAGDSIYIANTDAIVRFPYKEGETEIKAPGTKLTDLPAGPLNHHWTKTLVASHDGKKLYVSVGSNSNIAEHGMEKEEGRACVWEVDIATGQKRIYASGLRNAVGLAVHPQSGALWAAVNERDELGHDLVPDYMAAVKEGGFYGWPYSYFGQHVDERVKPQNPALVAKAIVPDYALGSHTAPLGFAFNNGTGLGAKYQGGAFVGLHGSWNREPPSGYKVIFVPFKDGKPAGPPETILDGFLDAEGKAMGRPVGVIVDGQGALIVADDVGNTVWRLRSVAPAQASLR